jgi:hypothetical protein
LNRVAFAARDVLARGQVQVAGDVDTLLASHVVLTGLQTPFTVGWAINYSDQVLPVMQLVPVIIGVFPGAPLLAREYAAGTVRFAWTRGVVPAITVTHQPGSRYWTLQLIGRGSSPWVVTRAITRALAHDPGGEGEPAGWLGVAGREVGVGLV